MAKRVKVAVRWDKKEGLWSVHLRDYIDLQVTRKKDAEVHARQIAREMWWFGGVPCELYLYNKDGKLGKGSRSRSTYGKDPRRSKG